MATKYSYDSKCKDLAEHFLPEDVSVEMVRDLSQAIQDCVEDFLSAAEQRAAQETEVRCPHGNVGECKKCETDYQFGTCGKCGEPITSFHNINGCSAAQEPCHECGGDRISRQSEAAFTAKVPCASCAPETRVTCAMCNDTGSVQDSEVPYLGNPCPKCK